MKREKILCSSTMVFQPVNKVCPSAVNFSNTLRLLVTFSGTRWMKGIAVVDFQSPHRSLEQRGFGFFYSFILCKFKEKSYYIKIWQNNFFLLLSFSKCILKDDFFLLTTRCMWELYSSCQCVVVTRIKIQRYMEILLEF